MNRIHINFDFQIESIFQTVDPVIKFRRNDSNACVPIGGYEVMWLDLYVPPGSLATYEIEAFGPGNLSQTEDNTMFLCDLRLIQVNYTSPWTDLVLFEGTSPGVVP